MVGEDGDAARRGDKKPVARSDCRYYCPDAATVERCIESIRDSDERLRARPEDMMLWDWECTYYEADPDSETGGGTILLGVAWYDMEFYEDRRDAWFGAMHKRVYAQIGIPLENVEVTHWRLDAAA
ncbi:hypothetical protein DZF91_12130 [Actinomadura logoneensis]|uniref:Uncharacterized protein n=1 Tax=Actinomadura logoneensis TaxID=2293572 RepID=A0A372JMZ7_9ACTN|nr:hypothetical protein DZF91_12130 [Actinomadura logoneensis]